MTKPAPVRTVAALLVLIGAAGFAETVEEKYDNGRIKLRYKVDAKGKKSGPLEEFDLAGKLKLRAEYKDGKLNGTLSRYEDGKPVFAQAFKNGEPVFARSVKDIKETLKKIAGKPSKGKDLAAQREAALRRLQMYRYLAGVPYEKMTLDDEFNRQAQAASVLCEKLKRLDHQPKRNPGMPAEEFKLGQLGAGNCNLCYGVARLAESVDFYMFDSDGKNAEWLGHRRWCIYPAMIKMGFGLSGKFSAMYSRDESGKNVPDFEFVAWPPTGYFPAEFFRANQVWNVSFNPQKYKPLGETVQARVYQADAQLKKVGEPLKLAFHKLNDLGIGLPRCVIFRPDKVSLAPGKHYLVEISGLKSVKGDETQTVSYPVIFVK